MTRKFRVTPRANDDLQQIADYNLARWGAAQMVRYLGDLDERFGWLADNPESGSRRDEVRPDPRSFVQGSRVIFYQQRKGGIEIVAVLHQSSEIEAHLRDRP